MSMKIILFVSKLSGGGAERVASEMSLHLPSDIKRTLVVLDEVVDYPYKGDVLVLKTKKASKYNILGRIFNIFSRLWQFHRIVRDQKPDWVITFSPALCLLSSLVFENTVARANTYHSKANPSLIERWKIRTAYGRARLLNAISYGVAEDLRVNFGIKKNIEVLHNPIDLEAITQGGKEKISDPNFDLWLQEGQPLFFTMGRLINLKGQWHLLRAFAKVNRNERLSRLIILGQGPLEKNLKQLAKDLRVEKCVYFAGFQSNPFSYLFQGRGKGVFIFSSSYEGFGKVIIEAMACGLPVISTDCRSGPREILAPDTDFMKEADGVELEQYGILTPVLDDKWRGADEPLTHKEEQLYNAMCQIISNSSMRDKYVKRSLERSKDFYIKRWIEGWLKILEYHGKR